MKMKLLLAVVALVCVVTGYRWKTYTDKHTYYAELSAVYLFKPSGVSTVQGRPVSRQELLDILLESAVKQTPGLKFDHEK